MKWFDSGPALFLENARLVDPVQGEQAGTLRLARGHIDSADFEAAGIAGPEAGGDERSAAFVGQRTASR